MTYAALAFASLFVMPVVVLEMADAGAHYAWCLIGGVVTQVALGALFVWGKEKKA